MQRRGEQLHLTWAPPASWPLPKSYFALLYRLQYELRNGTQVTAGRPSPGPAHAAPALALLRPPGPRLGSSRCRGGHWERGLTGGSAMAPSPLHAAPLGVPHGDPWLSPLLPAPAPPAPSSLTARARELPVSANPEPRR